MADEFQLVAGHLALDFANTLDYRFDPQRVIELLPSYERFLEFARQSGVITEPAARRLLRQTSERQARMTVQRAVELREALDCLFRSVVSSEAPSRSALQTLNSFLATAPIPDAIVWRNRDFLRRQGDLAERPDGPLWPIVNASASLLTSPARAHIRECSEPSCRWLFLDHSKNHSRRWCNMSICGNRTKAKRFRARQR